MVDHRGNTRKQQAVIDVVDCETILAAIAERKTCPTARQNHTSTRSTDGLNQVVGCHPNSRHATEAHIYRGFACAKERLDVVG